MTTPTFKEIHIASLTIGLLFLSVVAWAQFPSLSPRSTVNQEIGATNISIAYERPAMRGRTIFGGLVPYGKLWRTGAGNCTRIRFSRPVEIGKTPVPSGTYSLFTIPDVKSWTIILNKDTTLYGLDGYKPEKDIVRVTVPVQSTTRRYESLTFDIDVVPNNAVVYLSWANTQVSFGVETGVDKASTDFINASLLTGKSTNAEEYAVAAEYLYYLDRDLDQGYTLVNQAITLKKDLWYYRLKIDILEQQKKFSQGIAAADEAIQWVDSRQDLAQAKRAEYRGSFERRKNDLKGKGALK
jgi:hypothetical protein